MKAFTLRIVLLIAALFMAATPLQAAPSLPITEPPVSSLWPDGPLIDPGSINGQWFIDLESNKEEYRTHEFHDNTKDGGWRSGSRAITGFVIPGSIIYAPGGLDIIGFKIKATISNDTDSAQGMVPASNNSHGENRPATDEFYRGTLINTKLTAEFAIAELGLWPRIFSGPYRNPGHPSWIIADKEEQKAWYCWNPIDPPQGEEAGNYYVPTWDFGDIPVGQSATRILTFSVNPAMTSSDPRYKVIESSAGQDVDVFANRTSSLKISTWIDEIGIDYPGPEGMLRSSDVSVFHDIKKEPETSHKMHYPQWPDPFGWDVRACNQPDELKKVLADDFLCTSNGPITHITFWGSFRKDHYMTEAPFHGINTFHLSLHSDIPDPDGNGPLYSMPELPPLWEVDLNPPLLPPGWTITVQQEPSSPQGWYDPNIPQNTEHPNHYDYFRYDLYIPANQAFEQKKGTIYWLDISVQTAGPEWGWKTSGAQHFNDDAVWADMPVLDQTQWNELRDPWKPEISLDLAFIIDGEAPHDKIDWGDAPDKPYPTLALNNGARHFILGGGVNPTLGALVDSEPDGQPTGAADGDDTDALYPSSGDDEDGVTFLTPLIPGTVAQVEIVANGPTATAFLQGWIDFNGNGSWADPNEQIFTDVVLAIGTNTLTFLVPAGVNSGQTYARFRYSSTQKLQYFGPAQDGEVEDYQVDIEPEQYIDWGDAPKPYPTLAINNGAHHVIQPGMFLGAYVDPEPDGQPSLAADGDDNTSYDDEDGVFLTSLLMPGGYASVNVIASLPGTLDAWVDFEGNGTWTEASNQIFAGQPLTAGMNSLLFPVPLTVTTLPRSAYARFRYTSSGVASYTGLALDGEVEDYLFQIEPIAGGIDFGDAPDPTYPTLITSGGASHTIVPGIMLGAIIDPEPDGQPSTAADGDNIAAFNDEDGVTFTSKLIAGSNATVNVVAGILGGKLDAWVDFNKDGDWYDSGEKIFNALSVVPGLNTLSFPVPKPSALGPTYARFRISAGGTPVPTGLANNGEVEDYRVELYQPAPSVDLVITNLTFNAPHTIATIQWTVENGIAYQMESTTNLVSGPWIPAGSPVIGPLNYQSDGISTDSNKFYRVTAPWTP